MKIIIVEGKTDKERLLEVIDEPVEIVCTNGTLGLKALDVLAENYREEDVYIFLDADDAGNKARRLLKQEFSNAHHLYTYSMYREVATTPFNILSTILKKAHFSVK